MEEHMWVQATVEEMKKRFQGEGSGHDWWHVWRVWVMAGRLHRSEGGQLLTIELAALLHDVADWKFSEVDDLAGGREARKWMMSIDVPKNIMDNVCDIIDRVSFKGAGVSTLMPNIEGRIVQDADRLDAIGAIGIARAFAYGGFKGRPIHDPEADYSPHRTADAYKKSDAATIHHFYDKLLLLKDLMNTETAKKIAMHRHQVLERFLAEFYDEWEAKDI